MSPEKQRIAIAKACGYTNVHSFNRHQEGSYHKDGAIVGDKDGLTKRYIPDYLGDLNALAKAEKVLTIEQRWEYVTRLRSSSLMALRFAGDSALDDFDFCHATAAQRAEAFLRTLNLWEESK